MPFSRSGQARQGYPIGVVAMVSVVLVAAAFALTLWRYEHAQQSGREALAASADRLRTEEAAKVFWHEREAINEFLVTGRPSVLREVAALRTEFFVLTEGLAEGESSSQVSALAELRSANARLLREFEATRSVLRMTDLVAQLAAIEALHPFEDAVLRPLRVFSAGDLQTEQAATESAASALGQARLVAFLGALLALGAGAGFAIYASRLLRQVTRQSSTLERTLAEREQAQQALHDREDELRQAQKMEAVGRLAGGMAHDFNNVLMAITGYSDLAGAEVRPDQPELRQSIDQVKAAATLATALTGQLLAFSRQQVVQKRVLDLNDEIEGLAAMLGPLLGETVELSLELDPSGASVEADPGQLQQVVMNLAINARDAMPDGGQVAISVANFDLTEPRGALPAGPYVRLAVSDTGTGMDEETIARAFDPFFTTKEEGKGTGLGLATVHGIVTQNGGEIQITSEPGEGTMFSIYLPRTNPARRRAAPDRTGTERGTETVLVVDDVDVVRAVLLEILEREGYEVIAAKDGAEAIELARALGRPADLLLTDMVMPGMSGHHLSTELTALHPDLRVIYMSGHTQDAQLIRKAETHQVDFRQKPFSAATLVETARLVLDRPANGGSKATLDEPKLAPHPL